jgi:hypothetical protein
MCRQVEGIAGGALGVSTSGESATAAGPFEYLDPEEALEAAGLRE